MNTKQFWVAAGALIGGLAGVVAKLTVPTSVTGHAALGPVLLVAGIFAGGFIGERRC